MLKLKTSLTKNKRSKRIALFIVAPILVIGSLGGGLGYALYQQRLHSTMSTSTPKPIQKSSEIPKPTEVAAPKQAPQPTSKPTPTPPLAVKPPTTPCTSNTTTKLLLVSLSSQHMWACETSTLVNQSAVTTGMTQAPNNVDDATPTGSWQIYSKQTNQHLRGSDINGSWDDFVQYWIPFDGPIGFHDASWQTFPFGSSQYATNGSHGCVHLPLNIIAWVYDWAPIDTTVTIVD